MLRLHNPIQNYAWGSRTLIPQLLGVAPTGGPMAEVWMGAHPRAVSRTDTGEGLNVEIARNPDGALGVEVAKRYGGTLPYLLKVLAAEQPLSLQAHPNLRQAREGFAREEALGIARDAGNRTYRDASDKPELLCALSPFDALCGFRDVPSTIALWKGLGLPVQRLEVGLAACVEWLLSLDGTSVSRLATQAAERARQPVPGFEAECRTCTALHAAYPNDVGVVLALTLNRVHLEPGEALYLPAGQLHCYLKGAGVELMANSDNVVRGGLTEKYIDRAELLRVLDFTPRNPPRVRATGGAYLTPATEFELSRLDVAEAGCTLHRRGPDIVFVIDGRVELSTERGEKLELRRGESAFIPHSDGAIGAVGDGAMFRAQVGL